MRNSTYRVYRPVGQQIREAMHQFPTLVNTNNRDFSVVFSDAPEFKFHFTINERFPETSPKILLNGFDFPTSLTAFWQPTITVSQIVNHLHLIALARKNPNYSSVSQNISFKANLNSSMPPRFTNNHPDFNMTDPNENQDSNDNGKGKYHKNKHTEEDTKSEVEDDDEIDLDNIDVDSDKDFDDPPTELRSSDEELSGNKYSSIRSGHKSGKSNKTKSSNKNKNGTNKAETLEEEEEEVDVEINIREIKNGGNDQKVRKTSNRKYKLKPNANGAAIQNRDIFLDIEELDAVVTESEGQNANQKENEFDDEFDDDDDIGEEEEEEINEENTTFDTMIKKLGYLYLKKNIDTIGYIEQYKELKKLVPKETLDDEF